jgi:hypothetical protein
VGAKNREFSGADFDHADRLSANEVMPPRKCLTSPGQQKRPTMAEQARYANHDPTLPNVRSTLIDRF